MNVEIGNIPQDGYEVKYPSQEEDSFEHIDTLFPLSAAIRAGLAKIVNPDENTLYVVTPARAQIGKDEEMVLRAVVADWTEHLSEKEITTYTYSKCDACGAQLLSDDHEDVTASSIHCGYCNTVNNGSSPQPKRIKITELNVTETHRTTEREGTIDELLTEEQKYSDDHKKIMGKLKHLFTENGHAPRAVIEAGRGMEDAQGKIAISGPFSAEEESDLFLQVGDLHDSENDEDQRNEKIIDDRFPSTDTSYIVESDDEITDYNDYLVMIEADSGQRLPLVIMTDRDGNPSRFMLPVAALLNEGWELTLDGGITSLDKIIFDNNLHKGNLTSVVTAAYGRVKVFKWNNKSDRHDQITDALDDNDFNWREQYVSGDVPNGDVSKIIIEQTR